MLSLDAVGSAAAVAAAAKAAPRREGRIVLDDIDWVVISEQHGSRAPQQCLEKWYCSLCPSMVARGGLSAAAGLSPSSHYDCPLLLILWRRQEL